MATRVQFAEADADPAAPTFGATPTSGNLLVAIGFHRSGTSHTAFTISGSGWTKRVGHDAAIGDATFRRSMAIWTKIAGASEPTAVSIDNGTSDAKKAMILEFGHESGEDEFLFLEQSSGDNGTTANGTSISTGTTPAVSGTKFLLVGIVGVKVGGATNWVDSATWTNGLGSHVGAAGLANSRYVGGAFHGTVTTTGTKESTATPSYNGANSNNGLLAAILVFSLVAGAPPPSGQPAIRRMGLAKTGAHISRNPGVRIF